MRRFSPFTGKDVLMAIILYNNFLGGEWGGSWGEGFKEKKIFKGIAKYMD